MGEENDFTTCPGRVFNRPPSFEELTSRNGNLEIRRKTVALTVAQNLYEATKWWSTYHCGSILPDPPKQMYSCQTEVSNGVINCHEIKGDHAKIELFERLQGISAQKSDICTEVSAECCGWAASGECDLNPEFMMTSCQKSCNICRERCNWSCCPPKVTDLKKATDIDAASSPPVSSVTSELVSDTTEHEVFSVYASVQKQSSTGLRATFGRDAPFAFALGSIFMFFLLGLSSKSRNIRQVTLRRW